MIGEFIFNNISSSEFDLVCKSVRRPLLPEGKIKRVDLNRMSGVYDSLDDIEYGLRRITVRISYIGSNFYELRARARWIAQWLSTPNWARLIFNDEAGRYYLAKITSEIDLNTLFEMGTADLIFDCQPFAMSLNPVSQMQQVTQSPTTIILFNTGTREINFRSPIGSEYLINIQGSWDSLQLTSNGAHLSFLSPDTGTLIIDNVNMTVSLNGNNHFHKVSGHIDTFLKLLPVFNNQLVITGTNLNCIFNVSFIPLWI